VLNDIREYFIAEHRFFYGNRVTTAEDIFYDPRDRGLSREQLALLRFTLIGGWKH